MRPSAANIGHAADAAFFTALLVFFALCLPAGLKYAEGRQMFLFTGDYFTEVACRPGGLADYCARFLTQFFAYPWIGALIIALLLSLLAAGIRNFTRSCGAGREWDGLSMLPAAFYAALIANGNFELSGAFAMTAAIWAAALWNRIGSDLWRAILGFFAFVAVWLLFGGCSLVSSAMMVLGEAVTLGRRKPAVIAATVLGAAAGILAAPCIEPQLQGFYLLCGAHYFLYPVAPVWIFVALWGSVAIAAAAEVLLPALKKAYSCILVYACIFACGAFAVCKTFDVNREETLAYLLLTDNAQWDKVIAKASHKSPSTLYASVCLNLALAEKGLLPERCFHFPQNGTASLMSEDDYIFSEETLFRLGFINEARRYAYEAMVTIPDNQYGTMQVRRLAQTEFIAGREKVADKYLEVLSHTLLYRKWAAGMKSDPSLAELRKMQPDSSFTFSARDFTGMMRIMLSEHPDNKLIRDYYLCSLLLVKDLDSFRDEVERGTAGLSEAGNVPLAYDEAIAMLYRLGKIDPAVYGLSIDRETLGRLDAYISNYENTRGSQKALAKGFGNTYWYYMNFIKVGQ
jgi:hypothetical protein